MPKITIELYEIDPEDLITMHEGRWERLWDVLFAAIERETSFRPKTADFWQYS